MKYVDGKIAVPQALGLGVELDRDKVQEYAELFRQTGDYAYDRDPERPKWFAVMPERRFSVRSPARVAERHPAKSDDSEKTPTCFRPVKQSKAQV